MYGKFSGGYRVINKRATVEPQFRHASVESEYVFMQPIYVNTLPGTTSMVTPLAKSTPITQSFTNAYYIKHFATCKRYIATHFK